MDPEQNIVVTGTTTSSNFPTARPFQPQFGGGRPPSPGESGGGDLFVAKINSVGSALLYSTYFGGNGDDTAGAAAVDFLGNAYVGGYIPSGLPIKEPIEPVIQDGLGGFVAKLGSRGDLIWATPVTGVSRVAGIALDGLATAYVLGSPAVLLKIEAINPSFTLSDRRPGLSLRTTGAPDPVTTCHGQIQLESDTAPVAALALFGLRQNGVVISEAAVAASRAITRGRVPVIAGPALTGVAIANPNNESATVSFLFTNTDGNSSNAGTLTVPRNGHVTAFLHEAPFQVPSGFEGSFTFDVLFLLRQSHYAGSSTSAPTF